MPRGRYILAASWSHSLLLSLPNRSFLCEPARHDTTGKWCFALSGLSKSGKRQGSQHKQEQAATESATRALPDPTRGLIFPYYQVSKAQRRTHEAINRHA